MRAMTSNNLLVIGAGQLGCRVAQLWKQQHPEAKIFLKTRQDKPERSSLWAEKGYISVSEGQKEPVQAPNVVFCAPPTGNPDYDQDVIRALTTHWHGNSFVFTSSGGVYAENAAGSVDEASAVKQNSDYFSKILRAEEQVLREGGTVLRLGGLYLLNRGAHNYWLTSGKDKYESSPKGLINLLHYDDAASSVIQALKQNMKSRGKLYLVSDGVPISREEICKASLSNGAFQPCKMPQFCVDLAPDGKQYDTNKIRTELGWMPQVKSFVQFMEGGHKYETECPIILS